MNQLLAHTPTWVWIVFSVLILMGVRGLKDQVLPLGKVVLFPLLMLGLSISGMVNHFNQPIVLIFWLSGMLIAIAMVWMIGKPDLARFNASDYTVSLKGSGMPLALMMGIFLSKYIAEAMMAMHPELATHTAFAVSVALIYGFFNGFMFRTLLRVLMQLRVPLAAMVIE
ncbi:DUF6622 family protein [Iodobacter sp. CM08]|uniref:DUF6622 family protein n=1 Tax=Iodobacter sp. CM08 TaxID=3085902 RepID=UPI002981978B|nr:DUF6622 family protein [Iodobacter sp. CM08]MDW5417797.1 DUF6622 family protein [Iodobacter sp. CM08]